jgi:hypothetical protein
VNGVATRSPVERHADALAEMQRLTEEHAALRQQAEDDGREKLRYIDQIAYLKEQLEIAQTNERVVTRKLIRLCTAFTVFGQMADHAQAVLQSTKEWEEEGKPDDGAAAIVASFGTTQQER